MKKQLLLAILISLFNAYGLKSMSKPASRTYNEQATEQLFDLVEDHNTRLPIDLKKVEALLEEGADPNAREKYDENEPVVQGTITHWAIMRDITDPAFYDLMVRYKADLSLKDAEGRTPFDVVQHQLNHYENNLAGVENYSSNKQKIDRLQQLALHFNKLMIPPAPPAPWPAMPQGDQKTASADNAAAAAESKPTTAGATKP